MYSGFLRGLERWTWGGVLPAAAAGLARAAEPPGEYFKDDRWGYRVRTPKGWNAVAMSATEGWIASKHISPKELSAKKTLGWIEHPEMWVIAFPHGREKGAKVEEDGDKLTITINNPYKDYKDFLKRERWFVGGGYFFSKEEEGKIEDMAVSMYEIKVDKMVDAPFRMVAWVYHADDVDFAVQFKILEDWYEDYASTITQCLKSFRRIPRKTAMPAGQTTGDTITLGEDESKLSPEEKQKRRQEKVEQALAKEIGALPKDWISMRSAHYVALSHANEKFTKETLDFAEIVRGYLDETFTVGNEYVPPGIIRIFANSQEEGAFNTGTRWGLLGNVRQITVAKRPGEEKDWEYQWLAQRVTDQWIEFRNEVLSSNMPYWIGEGLARHMSFARPKGKRLEFKPDPYDQEQLREVVRKGNAIPLKDLFKGDSEKFKEHAHYLQAGSVVSWLLTDGNKGKCKGAVQTYLAALVQAVDEEQKTYEEKRKKQEQEREEAAKKKAEGEDGAPEAKSEEDDEAAEEKEEKEMEKEWEEYQKAVKEKFEAIRERAFQAAFGKLADSDWPRLDAAWQKFGG